MNAAKSYIKVFAPATLANVGVGFDILGLAVHEPGDEVEMELVKRPGITLDQITGDQGLLPTDPMKNTVSAMVADYLIRIGKPDLGVSIKLHKKMPIGSGLGSSAASTVAGLFAINQLLGEPLTRKELLPFAIEGERLACGNGHADNVAPSLLGGIVLIRSYHPLDVIPLPVPQDLIFTLIHPQIEVKTRDARNIIHQRIMLKDAVTQWGNIAGLISGLYRSDYELIGRSMGDILIEPSRSLLIPGFQEMKEKAMSLDALGFGISGSGPSVFALSNDVKVAEKIKEELQLILKEMEIESSGFISEVNKKGPKVISHES